MTDIWVLIILVVASVIVGFDVGYSAGKKKVAKMMLDKLTTIKKEFDEYNKLMMGKIKEKENGKT